MSIHLTRIYTRSGDAGTTSLTTGERVSKAHPRLEAYGTLDELNSYVGRLSVLCDQPGNPPALRAATAQLQHIQSCLFDAGTLLATPADQSWPGMPVLDESASTLLENWIDQLNTDIAPLQSFVLPGGNLANAEAHVCRTVCRRVERLLVHLQESGIDVAAPIRSYINRLSDYFFVFSRWVSHVCNVPEVLWEPNRGHSA